MPSHIAKPEAGILAVRAHLQGNAPLVNPAGNAIDIYAFITRNGGATWFGFPGGKDFS